jgi:hypothetical protein
VRSDAPIISRRATAQRVAHQPSHAPRKELSGQLVVDQPMALGLLMFDSRQHYWTEGGLRRRVDLARHQSGRSHRLVAECHATT